MANDDLKLSHDERVDRILGHIEQKGRATVAELTSLFQISESTVRRSLTLLAEQKLIRRFHGGAILNRPVVLEPPVSRRLQVNPKEKERIGRKAASLVEDGETLILLSGTTVAAMVPFLLGKKNLKVITHSVLVLQALLLESGVKVIVPGGVLDHSELCTTGFLTSLCVKQLRADKVFLGVRSVHPLYGMMSDNIDEMEASRVFIDAADEVIVLADHSKFNPSGTVRLCALSEVDVLITDSLAPADQLTELRECGVEVVVSDGGA